MKLFIRVLLFIYCLSVLELLAVALDKKSQVFAADLTRFELKRVGSQMAIRLFFDQVPEYKISENLSRQSLIFHLKQTQFAIADRQTERLFNDEMLEGVRFLQEGQDLWVQLKARTKNLVYTLEKEEGLPNVLTVEFRPRLEVLPTPPPPEDPELQLEQIRFGNHPPDYTRVVFRFKNSKEPRMLILRDAENEKFTIRFSNTHPIAELETPVFENERIKFVDMTTDPNQTFVKIDSTSQSLEVQSQYLLDPPRWVIDFYGEGRAIEEVAETEEQQEDAPKELTEAEQLAKKKEELAQRRANLEKRRAELNIRSVYADAERLARANQISEAIATFGNVYKLANVYESNFGNFHALGIQSLFRQADLMQRSVEKSRGKNYHRVIEAYQTAMRIAKQKDIDIDLFPNALLQIGQSYRQMNFFFEANRTFDRLQKEHPHTVEAIEAYFWRAVGHLDQQKWEEAIKALRQYLRGGPKPHRIAASHYRMGQAFYHLQDYAKAKEAFNRAKVIDPQYPFDKPELLFHMGESYYETADYTSARHAFRLLLERYPDADFSKFVALRLGDFLRDEGKELEAIEVYKKAASSFQQEIQLLGNLRIADIYAKRPYSNDYQRALKIYDKALDFIADPSLQKEILLRKGLTLTTFGHYLEAVKTLKNFQDTFPDSLYVQNQTVQKTIQENLKGELDARFQNDQFLEVLGLYQDYRSDFKDFQMPISLLQVGESFRQLGLYDDAIETFSLISKDELGGVKELGQIHTAFALAEKGDSEVAIQQFRTFLNQYPQSLYQLDAHKQLAGLLTEKRRYSEALDAYHTTIDLYQQSGDPLKTERIPHLYYAKAKLHTELGQHRQAAEAYHQVAKRYQHTISGEVGKDTPFYIAMSLFLEADSLYELEKNQQALEAFQQAIDLYQNSKHAEIQDRIQWSRYKIGTLQERMGKDQEALEIFKTLSEMPGNPLWKDLALQNYQALTKKLAYQNYLGS